jgi:enamine deaminase RidA (YjgF/YER057c/UK114 family)
MAHAVEMQLSKLGIVLPQAPVPAANYLPYVISGNLVFVAGQAAIVDGKHPYVGRLGAELSVADGRAATRIAAINVLAQVKAACGGDWNCLVRCVQLHGYINATAEFAEHPAVLDGASNLLVELLGDAGKHVRTAVGAVSLRNRTAVVLDAVFELRNIPLG